MTTFTIQREHMLGIEGARQLARQWANHARRQHEMDCCVHADEAGERVTFERSGVQGDLVADADRFTVNVTLGFLLGGFTDRIRDEVEKNLDAAIAKAMAASGAGSEEAND